MNFIWIGSLLISAEPEDHRTEPPLRETIWSYYLRISPGSRTDNVLFSYLSPAGEFG
jgi:hypothetical protein